MAVQGETALKSDIQNYETLKRGDYKQGIADVVEDVIDSYKRREFDVTVGTESSNTISITIQAKESDGSTDVEEAIECRAQVLDTDGNLADKTAFKFTAVSTGTADNPSSPDEPSQSFTTDATGTAVLDLDDVATASGKTVEVIVEAFDDAFVPTKFDVTFD